jgi:predicted metal-dependent hydrolase
MSSETVLEGGRSKAYRPLPAAQRGAALVAGLAAYDRGDWFEAHERLEPAWMGTRDPDERALHSGLIKLAAAGVHATRGNATGVAKNLVGARRRLGSIERRPRVGPADDIDIAGLVAAIDARLSAEADRPSTADPPPIPRRP